MSVPNRKITLPAATTTGTGTAVDCGLYPYVAVTIVGTGTISAGTIVIEEADTQSYASTWSAIGAPVVVTPTSGGGVMVVHLPTAAYGYIRARVTSNVTGGGSITVSIRGLD